MTVSPHPWECFCLRSWSTDVIHFGYSMDSQSGWMESLNLPDYHDGTPLWARSTFQSASVGSINPLQCTGSVGKPKILQHIRMTSLYNFWSSVNFPGGIDEPVSPSTVLWRNHRPSQIPLADLIGLSERIWRHSWSIIVLYGHFIFQNASGEWLDLPDSTEGPGGFFGITTRIPSTLWNILDQSFLYPQCYQRWF